MKTLSNAALQVGFCASLLLSCAPCEAGLIYRTDFETFAAGDDHWVGTDGWIGNGTGLAVHGIDQDVIEGGGLGKTAFIGFRQPAARLTFVAKPVNYSPGSTGLPLVRVETLIGIQDSVAKSARDSFFVSVYNGTGGYLAGIRFDNRPATYGIWRADGLNPDQDTGVIFYRGELHILAFTVDLSHNTWSADLDGVPLFTNAVFTATTRAVNFGLLAYEWQLGATATTGYGDNWMLVADTVIRSAAIGTDPFCLTSFHRSALASTLVWPAQKGFDYRVEYSADLVTWLRDLPGSSFPMIASDQTLSFSDTTTGHTKRFYRIARDDSP